MDEIVLVYTTWPDAETAQAAGEAAVLAGAAACANVLAPMHSIYRWRGALHRETETPMLLKTRAGQVNVLRDLILSRHPYDTPCFIGLSIDRSASNSEFAAWIEEQTSLAP